MLRYLLTHCPEDENYHYVEYDERGQYMVHNNQSISGTNIDRAVPHGPAVSTDNSDISRLSVDMVRCCRCLVWPSQAADWPTRHRNYDWPDSATVEHVAGNGCDIVRVAHRQCRQDEWMNKHQWRLSFSRAEIVLINSWMPVQQIVYYMLRVFMKTEQLTDRGVTLNQSR